VKLGVNLREKCVCYRVTLQLQISENKIFLKTRCLHITTAFGGAFEREITCIYIILLLGHFENKVLYRSELPSVAGGKCLVCLPLLKHTTVHNPDIDLI